MNHDLRRGTETVQLRDSITGSVIEANWIGEDIEGFPGYREAGKVLRPPNYRSYVRLGEIGLGKLEPIESPERLSNLENFWRGNLLILDRS